MLKRSGKTQNQRRYSGNFSVVCIMVMVLCFFCSLFTAAVFAAGNEAGTEVRVIVLDKTEQPERPGGGDSGSSGTGGSSGNTAESISDGNDHGGTGSEENQNWNPDSEERGSESGNLNGSADENRNAGSGVAEDGEECEDQNANGCVTDGKSMRESIRAGDQKDMIDRDSERTSADSVEAGAVPAAGQNASGCRCIWARLFGTCVLCMPFHDCLRWWCWFIPLLLLVLLETLIFQNRKKRHSERKRH